MAPLVGVDLSVPYTVFPALQIKLFDHPLPPLQVRQQLRQQLLQQCVHDSSTAR
jgi:hypothetical protein